jgi:hypothetical protein
MPDITDRSQSTSADPDGSSATVVAAGVANPQVVVAPVADPAILDQGRVFSEAIRQTLPVAPPGTEIAARIAEIVRDGTARPTGITVDTAHKYVTSTKSLDSLMSGAYPAGKAAEIVTALDCRPLLSQDYNAFNLIDVRISPDPTSQKDLLVAFQTGEGCTGWDHHGQVKTGSKAYVTGSLIRMAQTPGYGKIAYVDSRYVNPDSTPRVAPDAFTEGQARRLKAAGVRLCEIADLEKRAQLLCNNVKAAGADGLDPVAREQLRQLRDDIARAYRPSAVATRIMGGTAIAAATAAVLSLIVQLATDGKVDASTVHRAAGTGAVFGLAGVVADAGVYQIAITALGMTPETAQAFAQRSVGIGFCLVAVVTDLVAEARSVQRGESTVADAIGGTAAKTALDLLPLVMSPLGLAGLPILVGAQVGGRWLLARARAADRLLERAIAQDMALAEDMGNRLGLFSEGVRQAVEDCDETDARFHRVLASKPRPRPNLQLVEE